MNIKNGSGFQAFRNTVTMGYYASPLKPALPAAIAQFPATSRHMPFVDKVSAILRTKALLKHGPEVIERINLEAEAFVDRTKSSAAKEAFSAFMEKRKPNFSGLN